jgi:hypothetical protein
MRTVQRKRAPLIEKLQCASVWWCSRQKRGTCRTLNSTAVAHGMASLDDCFARCLFLTVCILSIACAATSYKHVDSVRALSRRRPHRLCFDMWSFSDKNLATILVSMPVFFFTVFARSLALQDFFSFRKWTSWRPRRGFGSGRSDTATHGWCPLNLSAWGDDWSQRVVLSNVNSFRRKKEGFHGKGWSCALIVSSRSFEQ